MSLAPSALVQLDSACDLFSKTAHIFHAEKVLVRLTKPPIPVGMISSSKTYITLGIQRIMLNLREKAHASLSAHRNTPPSRQGTLSEPSTPADDNDELSTLGGRTRLVAQKEKSVSPTMGELSPTSLNPIVPFPLKEFEGAAHPYVLEYLRTFAHPHNTVPGQAGSSTMGAAGQAAQPGSPFDHTTFAHDVPLAAHDVALGSVNTTPQFIAGGLPYRGQPPQAPLSPMEGMTQQNLPQYFPVFDYGYTGGEAFSALSPEADITGRSYSPDGSMQTAWQDFVAQIGHM